MKDKLHFLKKQIMEELEKVTSGEALRQVEVKYMGRKGELTKILKGIKDLSDAKKKEVGQLANKIRDEIQAKITILSDGVSDNKQKGFVDISLPGIPRERGNMHPLIRLQYELEDIFSSLGFMVLDGPELESDYYCFEALNIPSTHPARDMQDTFYIDKKNKDGEYDLVMRVHTSSVQVRAMQKHGAPIRCVVPGRVFRCEATDACHEHTFDQMEGLMVAENLSVSNLIAVMKELLNGIFKREVETRVRPGFFPFVEPGIELDIRCTICEGKGCASCKHSGWLELLPAGMVHPRVLEYGGIDSKKYTGFAFGLGLTRLAMMRYGIADIRVINSGDLRSLKQF